MSHDEIDAAVERVRGRAGDELAGFAESAAGGLTAGEGVGMLDQAGVQEFLWYRVPKSYPPDHWDDVIGGAAALFDELGRDRYAAIARSDRTAGMLDAWRRGRSSWRKAFASAMRASGVEPPDTDILAWGTVFGPQEASARHAVEGALESALVAGDLVPGRRGAKEAAVAITGATLTAPVEAPPGQNLATLVTTERAERWVSNARSVRDDRLIGWRDRAVRQVLGPIDPPDDVAGVAGPMAWLLRHASEGIELTQSLYIARTLVVEAAERFGWWDWDKPPRSEVDVPQLGDVRAVATECRWVRRKGRTLAVTAAGRHVMDDTVALWTGLVGTLGGSHAFDRTVGELVAHRLLDGHATHEDLVDAVGPAMVAMGWQAEGRPVARDEISWAVWDRWRWWRVLSLVDEEPSVWDRATQRQVHPRTTGLTAAGRPTVLAYLRGLATGPRHDVRL